MVEGVKRSRGKESAIHRACAGLFYKMMSKAVKIDMSRASDFKLLDRKAVDALLEMPEKCIFPCTVLLDRLSQHQRGV